MITWTISSRADLETYVADAFPDAATFGLDTALVDALVLQCPVDYGRDWTEWLDDNAAGYLAELSESAGVRRESAAEGREGGFPGHEEDA